MLPLEAVNKNMADRTGNKMANLGEVKNQVGLSVPEGFVITASAYDYFQEKNQLQDEINRRIQFLEPSDIAQLHETSSEIQKSIINAVLPPELEEVIFSAYQNLINKTGQGTRVFHAQQRPGRRRPRSLLCRAIPFPPQCQPRLSDPVL